MNELTNSTVDNFYRIAENAVVFEINLNTHVHLADRDVVQRCMEEYAAKYPNASYWEAKTATSPRGHRVLLIKVSGNINEEI